jgi:hypothetical protein
MCRFVNILRNVMVPKEERNFILIQLLLVPAEAFCMKE